MKAMAWNVMWKKIISENENAIYKSWLCENIMATETQISLKSAAGLHEKLLAAQLRRRREAGETEICRRSMYPEEKRSWENFSVMWRRRSPEKASISETVCEMKRSWWQRNSSLSSLKRNTSLSRERKGREKIWRENLSENGKFH